MATDTWNAHTVGSGIIVEAGVELALFNNLCVSVSGNTVTGTNTADFFDSDIVLNVLDANATMRVTQTAAQVSSLNGGAHARGLRRSPRRRHPRKRERRKHARVSASRWRIEPVFPRLSADPAGTSQEPCSILHIQPSI